jgi:Na+/H+ antiporter NhaD/arsenite permease-like protein
MDDYAGILTVFCLFVILIVVHSKDRIDTIAWGILITLIASVFVALRYNTPLSQFIEFIDVQTLMYLIGISMIIEICEDYKIFQYLAVQIIRITHGSPRRFFYIISIISTLSGALLQSVSVVLIYIPIILQTVKVLKIKAEPFIYGVLTTVNLGNLISPFSSPSNIILASTFSLDFQWFAQKTLLFALVIMILHLILIDLIYLRKQAPPDEEHKHLLLELLRPEMIIAEPKTFWRNILYLLMVIFALIIIKEAYMVALIGAALLAILNKKNFTKYFKKIDWKTVFTIVLFFLFVGNMLVTGIIRLFTDWLSFLTQEQYLVALIIILLIALAFSAFLDNVVVTLIFIPILQQLILIPAFNHQGIDLLLLALIFGLNLGMGFIPQSSPTTVITFNLAEQNNIQEITLKKLVIVALIITIFDVFLGLGYLAIRTLI